MKKALKTTIRGLDKSQFQRLRELSHHAKNLYNQTLWTLRQAYDATGKYFTYPQMDKAMKQVENLEGEINYKLLKASVSQQTLRRIRTSSPFFVVIRIFKIILVNIKGNHRSHDLNTSNMNHRCHIHLAVNESNEAYTVHKTALISMLMQTLLTTF